MNKELLTKIRNNPIIYSYLREDSSWYERLNRGEDVLKELEETAKKFYKQTPEDKLKKLSKKINMEFFTFIKQ